MIYIKVFGNVESLRTQIIKELGSLYDIICDKDQLVPTEILDIIVKYSAQLNKEIAVYMTRKGTVAAVCVGDNNKVSLPEIEGRRDIARLSGIRCIHTHPGGDGRLSSVDLSTLIKLRLDAMIAVGFSSDEADNSYKIRNIYAGILKRDTEGLLSETEIFGPFMYWNINKSDIFDLIEETDRQSSRVLYDNMQRREKAILVGFEKSNSKDSGDDSLLELEELAKTSGAEVVGRFLQRRQKADAAYYIGRGKAEELSLARQALNADLIIFDDELTGANIRNLEEVIGARVIDRTTLILDIFAARARSIEGKLQVELAQLKYMLPRLTGRGIELSRLGGGIGTRGPGETQLETDRRHIGRRIKFIEKQLAETSKKRQELRNSRRKTKIPIAALAGYTNAGKSTLLNKLCNSEVLAEDKLFATLDPTIRKIIDPKEYGREALLVDTVGFIRKLPHDLVEAFKSTLEETIYSDLIIHLVDASNPSYQEHIDVVNKLLDEIGAGQIPRFLVFNKMDAAIGNFSLQIARTMGDKVFFISALTGEGLLELSEAIFQELSPEEVIMKMLIPFSDGASLSYLHEKARVEFVEYMEEGVMVEAVVTPEMAQRFSKYEIEGSGESDEREL